jgi:hypothetical protein
MNNIDPERQPSLPVAVASALARAGWSAEKIADGTGLPRAFAELLHERALQDGEAYPSADDRLLAALLDRIRRWVSEPNPSRGTRGLGAHPPPGPGGGAVHRVHRGGGPAGLGRCAVAGRGLAEPASRTR